METKGGRAKGKPEDAGGSRAIRYAWLCSSCFRSMTVCIDDENRVAVVRRSAEEWTCEMNEYEEQTRLAERELSSFVRAVTDLYGEGQATLSAQDWLDQFQLIDGPTLSPKRAFRDVTIAAAARLADRLNSASNQADSSLASD
jgi:hypothetical protein